MKSTGEELNWNYMEYPNNSWKSRVFRIDGKLYIVKAYSNLYDVVTYKGTNRIKSAKRDLVLYEVDRDINLATAYFRNFENKARTIRRVGISLSASIEKSFDGYADNALKTMATELEPTYERKRYKYDVVDSGEVIINLNNKKVLVDIKTGNFKLYIDTNKKNSVETGYNDVVLGDFLKSYIGNVRIIDTFEVPSRKIYSGPYMKKVQQIIYEGTLSRTDLGINILDKTILDRKIQLVSLNNSDEYRRIPVLEITLKQSK